MLPKVTIPNLLSFFSVLEGTLLVLLNTANITMGRVIKEKSRKYLAVVFKNLK